MQVKARFWRVGGAIGVATAALAAVFLTWPEVDLRVAGWFYDPGVGFALSRNPVALALRDSIRALVHVAPFAFVALGLVGLALGHRRRFPLRVTAFALVAAAIGPGLIAEWLLKTYWGRARPEGIVAFGGEHALTPPFVIADACSRNCSFVSGEVAAMAALALIVGVIVVPAAAARWRWPLAVGLALPVLATAILRMAMGKHFLSDAVFAVSVAAFGVWVAYGVCRLEAARARITAGAIGHDLRRALGRVAGRRRTGRDA
jgi:membrane-associated phospholipid phosphatase